MLFEMILDDPISKKAVAFSIALTICLPFLIPQIQCVYFDFKYLNKSQTYMENYKYLKKAAFANQANHFDKLICFYKNGIAVRCDWDQDQQMIMYDPWPLGFSTSFYYKYDKGKVSWIYTKTSGPDLTL